MTIFSCNRTVIKSGIGSTFVDGNIYLVNNLCLEDGLGGLVVEVGGGSYQAEISWSLTFPSGSVAAGVAGVWESGLCVSSQPTTQPSLTPVPTAPCQRYTIELYDAFGDG